MIILANPSAWAAPAHVLFHQPHAGAGLDVEPACVEGDALAVQRDFRMFLVAPDEACETGLSRAGAPNGVEQREILTEKRIALDDADVRFVRRGRGFRARRRDPKARDRSPED